MLMLDLCSFDWAGFIDDGDRPDNPDEDKRSSRRHSIPMVEEDDTDAILDALAYKYGSQPQSDYVDEGRPTEVEQQALLPSVKDPKLWMVKCAVGCKL